MLIPIRISSKTAYFTILQKYWPLLDIPAFAGSTSLENLYLNYTCHCSSESNKDCWGTITARRPICGICVQGYLASPRPAKQGELRVIGGEPEVPADHLQAYGSVLSVPLVQTKTASEGVATPLVDS